MHDISSFLAISGSAAAGVLWIGCSCAWRGRLCSQQDAYLHVFQEMMLDYPAAGAGHAYEVLACFGGEGEEDVVTHVSNTSAYSRRRGNEVQEQVTRQCP
jgi:hypothetical protein